MKIPTFVTLLAAFAVLLGASVRTEAKEVGFSATISEIRITRQFDSKTIVAGVDPRFLVTLTLHQDVDGIGKNGDSISFAIHSLARDLNITDQKTAVGNRILWKVSRDEERDMTRLRRIMTEKSRQKESSEEGKSSESLSE